MDEMPGMIRPDLQALPQVKDRMTFLYLEHCTLGRQDGAITVTDEKGIVQIPAAGISVLLLGPGTRVTHRAMELMGDTGVGAVWVGEHGVRYYAHGRPLTTHSQLLLRQAELVSNTRKHMDVVRKMYQLRFPDEDISRLTMQQLRGREGSRVRQVYRKASKDTGIPWSGRLYRPEDFTSGDAVNQALSAGHACLYGLAHAVIVALGCAPGLGFVHVGHECSFVYDLADLYKAEVTIPIAFEVAAQAPDDLPAVVRRRVRDAMVEHHILERMVHDIRYLLLNADEREQEPEAVYLWDNKVGNVSSRVRDALWERVCQNLKNGQATLVFTTAGEQRMDFRTHNTAWETVDFDGIKLMRRPLPQAEQNQIDLKPGFSKAAQQQMARKAGRTKPSTGNYTVIDLETTGLKAASDSIIEYGALRVRDGVPVEELTMLVCVEENVPAEITALTGLSAAELQQGTEPREALNSFLLFIGKDPLVGHNITFDLEFLRMTCKRYGFPAPTNRQIDLAQLARRNLTRIANYKLVTLAQHFQLVEKVEHRALPDCRLIQQVYCKLKETAVQ